MFKRKKTISLQRNEKYEKVEPILLEIFCLGMLEAKVGMLFRASLYSLFMVPLTFVIALAMSLPKQIILISVFVIFHTEISDLGVYFSLVVVVAFIALNYKEVIEAISLATMYLINIISFGGALRAVCKGFIDGNIFADLFFKKEIVNHIVVTFIICAPMKYESNFDNIVNEYTKADLTDDFSEVDKLVNLYHEGKLI